MRSLIIGGGIGGLSAAIALRRAGLEVRVFENAPELLEVGAAITLWSNALKAARRLGVDDAITRAGGEVRSGRIQTWRGKPLFDTPVAEVSREIGAPSLCLPRASLQRILADAAGRDVLRLGTRCVGVSEDEAGITARFADGSSERGDLLVGADGLRSVVRDLLFGPEALRHSGHRCWRGITTFRHPSIPAGHSFEAWGPGASFGMLPMDGERVYWFASEVAAPGTRDAHPAEALRRRFSSWPAPIPELIEATPEPSILLNDILDRPPSRRWGRGRITLLGDAIHPMTPNLGQGGCLAMEDAVVLGDCLRGSSDPARALRTYEKRRRARCAWIVRQSRDMGRLGLISNPVVAAIRDFCIRALPTWWFTRGFRKFVDFEA